MRMQGYFTRRTDPYDPKQSQNVLNSSAPITDHHEPSTSTNINTHPMAVGWQPTMQDATGLNSVGVSVATGFGQRVPNIGRTTPRNGSGWRYEYKLAFILFKSLQVLCYLVFVYTTLKNAKDLFDSQAPPVLFKIGTCLNFVLASVTLVFSFDFLKLRCLSKTINYELVSFLSIVHSILSIIIYKQLFEHYMLRDPKYVVKKIFSFFINE